MIAKNNTYPTAMVVVLRLTGNFDVAEALKHASVEHDLQSAAPDVPAHRGLGAWVEVAAGVNNARAWLRPAGAHGHDRCGAVAEQAAGH